MVIAREQRFSSWISSLDIELKKSQDRVKELEQQLKEAEKVISYFAELDEDDIERCHGFQAKYKCEEYLAKYKAIKE